MHPRTTTSGPAHRAGRTRRPSAALRRPALYLSVAAAGAVLVNVLAGGEPAAQAGAEATQPVSVAEQLGLAADAGRPADAEDLRLLEQLSAGRSTREAEQVAAQQVQAAADQAVL